MDDNKYIEVGTHRAIMDIPENAVSINLIAKIYEKDELLEVSQKYDLEQIREMFRKADDGYIDDDDRFVITDKGLAWLEEQRSKGE